MFHSILAPYTSYNFTFRCNAATLTDALKVYSIATLNLTEAAARGVSLTAESVSALASLTSDPLKALTIGKKVKQATKAIKMSVNVIPLIQRNIKENTEKLKYKKANEGQEVKEE